MNEDTWELEFDRETKNTVRYQSPDPDAQSTGVDTLYINKSAFKGKDYPKVIKVRVEIME